MAGGGAGGAAGAGGGEPFTCGTATCRPEQYCIVPCCEPTIPPCNPKPDDGVCPPETTDEGACCREMPCTPRPRYCSDTANFCLMMGNRVCVERCG